MQESEPIPAFDSIAIIGLGLIGSSIARGVKLRGLARSVTGCDPNEISLAYGRKQGFIDSAASDAKTAVTDCELVILATPPSALAAVAQAIGPHLAPGTVVMDVASVKQAAIDAIAPHLPPGVSFMPAHPIAGSEQSGVSAGRADLFERKLVLLTPEAAVETPLLQKATGFWRALGARVEAMPPALHDQVYAYVSHLPQLLAFAAAPCIPPDAAPDSALQKFLRLSGSNPALWLDIFLLNKDAILTALDRYLDITTHIEKELAQAPEDAPNDANEALARTALFPRIAASCLITTLMEAEKKAGFSFARYAGTGFADFTTPALEPPDADIERISGQYQAVRGMLGEYRERLQAIHAALAADDKALKKAITI